MDEDTHGHGDAGEGDVRREALTCVFCHVMAAYVRVIHVRSTVRESVCMHIKPCGWMRGRGQKRQPSSATNKSRRDDAPMRADMKKRPRNLYSARIG